MVSSVGIGMHDGPPSPHGDAHHHHSSRMDGQPPPPMDYRHAPPGYGGPPPPPMPHGYPYPPPYYGGPAPPSPYGMPPGAYPPYYGHPGYGPPPPPQPHGAGGYGYGYDPSYGYPSQQPRDAKKPDSGKLPQRKPASGRGSHTSPPPAPLSSEPSPSPQQQAQWRAPSVSSESSPTAAAAADFVPSQVKPIETDFHFFVKEMSVVLRPVAEEEVHKSIADKGSLVSPSDVLYLINSNLNTRLIKAWEDLTPAKRLDYMTKEENDRRRFMNEDSVASRHCATLTARNKSPRADANKNNKESRDPSEHRTGKPSPAQSTGSSGSDDVPYDESPLRNSSPDRKSHSKDRINDEDEEHASPSYAEHNINGASLDEEDEDVDESDDPNKKGDELELTVGKRVGSPTTPEEEEGTPTKRNRRDGDLGEALDLEGREAL